MKALPTQFDDRSLSGAVATPTCGGCCCCCCCCLATTITSTSLLTQRIAKDTKTNNIANRGWLIALAVLIGPITTLVSVIVNYMDSLIATNLSILNVQANLILGILTPFALLLLALRYLYGQVHVNKPLKRAILVTVLISVAFVLEFFGGAFLILNGIGGIIYLLIVPVIVGWINVWYYRHLGKETNDSVALAATIQPAYTEVQLVDNHDAASTSPDQHTTPQSQEPPKPNSPAPGAQ